MSWIDGIQIGLIVVISFFIGGEYTKWNLKNRK